MELLLKDGEFEYYGNLVKLSDMQNYVDPEWKKLGIDEYWYHQIRLKNKQEVYVLDKHHYECGKGLNQIPPTKLIKHRNKNITIKFNKMKVCVNVLILY